MSNTNPMAVAITVSVTIVIPIVIVHGSSHLDKIIPQRTNSSTERFDGATDIHTDRIDVGCCGCTGLIQCRCRFGE